ncbi:MAG TPA: hypothetical protein VG894_11880 [Bauldia sp.]|nr:hypothetical protein [Bauldia sp.]
MLRTLTSVLVVTLAMGGNAMAADYGSYGPAYGFGSNAPSCSDTLVGAKVIEKFAYQDARIVHSGVTIASLSNPRQTGVGTPWHGRVDRRFCSATAWLTDGHKAEAVYVIEGPYLAAFGLGWHVDSCVAGHDPWRVYDALCRSIRPQ